MAPFRCVGFFESKYQACHGAPIQPGSSCDYCAQGIMLVSLIKGADGKEFKVGCDCVAKIYRDSAGTDTEREMRKLHDEVLRRKTAADHKRKDKRIAEAKAVLEEYRPYFAERIWDGVVRHSHGPRSVADQIDWMLSNGGRACKLRGVKLLETMLGDPV